MLQCTAKPKTAWSAAAWARIAMSRMVCADSLQTATARIMGTIAKTSQATAGTMTARKHELPVWGLPMGKKAERQAARIAGARWREFCDSWFAIGRAADRELRTLEGRLTSEERESIRRRRRVSSLLAIAAMLGGPQRR